MICAEKQGMGQMSALERLAKLRQEVLDEIDGATETRGRDTWITRTAAEIEGIERQLKSDTAVALNEQVGRSLAFLATARGSDPMVYAGNVIEEMKKIAIAWQAYDAAGAKRMGQ